MSLIVPFFSLSLLSLFVFLIPVFLCVALSSCHIVYPVYGHVFLICSILPIPLGFIVHIGCCVQKTNGSVSSGPGKELPRYRHKTCCIFFLRHAVVHVSIILSVGHPPPALTSPAVTTPHSHSTNVLYKLCVDIIVWMLLKYSSLSLMSYFRTTVHKSSPRCLIIFGLILYSCPVLRTGDQTVGFYPLVHSSVFLPCCPTAHSLETGTQVTWLWHTSQT